MSPFVKASTYISTVVARIYPTTNTSSGRFGNSGIYATGSGDHKIRRCGRSMAKDSEEDVGEEAEEVEEDTDEDAAEEE